MAEVTEDDAWPTVANAVCADLGAVIARTISEAVELESIYWTVSDYPNTVGGRLATLNVGSLEVLYVPREPYKLSWPDSSSTIVHCSHLNIEHGTVTYNKKPRPHWQNTAPIIANMIHQPTYPIGPVDHVMIPTGQVGQALDHPEICQAVRELCLNLMRSNQSGLFRRWHSPELARRAYEEHVRVLQQDSYRL
jgi:hypothetical protein